MKNYLFVVALAFFISSCALVQDLNLGKSADKKAKSKVLKNTQSFLQESLTQWQEKCESNEAKACYTLAMLYYEGKGIKQDYEKAKLYWQKACSLNNALSCTMLGISYDRGEGVVRDYKRAEEYYKKACSLGNAEGCKLEKVLIKKILQ